MRVCLATVHCEPLFTPLALLYLKTFLIERMGMPDASINTAEFSLDDDSIDGIAERLLVAEADVIGLSCYVWNVTTLMEIVKIVKARQPQTAIVLGGPEVGPVAMAVLDAFPDVDVIVKSEGEVPFAEIVERLGHGRRATRSQSRRAAVTASRVVRSWLLRRPHRLSRDPARLRVQVQLLFLQQGPVAQKPAVRSRTGQARVAAVARSCKLCQS